MTRKLGFVFSYRFFSQAITSVTNFVTSICAINYLNPEEFRKWFVYVVSTLAIQGVLRTTVLESDLIDYGKISSIRSRAILIASLFPFVVMLSSYGYSRSSFSDLDIALAIYCTLILIQDVARYRFLSVEPRITLYSDAVWLSVVLILLSVGTFFGLISLFWFLGLSILGPLLGCVVFLMFHKSRIKKSRGKVLRVGDSQRRYLLVQSVFGTLVTLFTLFTLARYCSAGELETIRIIQTIASPFYSLAAAYWLTIVAGQPNTRNFNEDLSRTIRNLAGYLVFLSTVSILIYLLGDKTHFVEVRELVVTMIIAVSVPIVNAITYPTSYILRSRRQYLSTMKISLMVSGLFLCSIIYVGSTISAIVYFFFQLMSIILIQFLNIYVCKRIEYNQNIGAKTVFQEKDIG